MRSDATEFDRDRGVLPVAVAVIAASYAYYLIFAETAFLRLAEGVGMEPRQLAFLRTVLGAGGIAGGLLGGWRFKILNYSRIVSWAMRACAMMAVLALVVTRWEVLLVVAGGIGVTLGWLLVALVAGLRGSVGTPRLGLCVGLGVGIAQAIFSLPWVTAASPTMQVVLVTVLVSVAAVATPWLMPQEPSLSWALDYRGDAMAAWMAIFMALIWTDAATLFVLPAPGPVGGVLAAVTVLAASIVAGLALDRLARASVALAALVLLVMAGGLVAQGDRAGLPALLASAAGGGVVATALFHLAARGGRPLQTGLLFGLSLWAGSAFGVGMARESGTVPATFLAGAVVVVLGALGWREKLRRDESRTS